MVRAQLPNGAATRHSFYGGNVTGSANHALKWRAWYNRELVPVNETPLLYQGPGITHSKLPARAVLPTRSTDLHISTSASYHS